MFNFNDLSANAGSDGVVGPFINWQARAGQHAQAQTWTLRSKADDNSTTVEDITAAFQQGVVFDYNTIKLGWEKWAPLGQRSDVQWAATPNLQTFPRPSNDKRTNEMGREVFVWQKTFAVRIAISPTVAGSWNQSAFGAMQGFEAFIEQLKVAGPQHIGKLPKVQFQGAVEGYGGALVPTLAITDWLDAPACLKQEPQGVAQMSAGTPTAAQPASQPTQQPAPAQVAPTAATAGGF